jgi:membrane-bound lytic murein transglycosylase F
MKITDRIIVFGFIFIFCHCFSTMELVQARDLEQIIQSGELRACIVPVTPSYAGFVDPDCRYDCAAEGPVVRVVTAFADFLGQKVRPVFHRIDWDEQFHDASGKTVREGTYTPHHLNSGNCDIYPSHLTKNEWRLKKMDFATLFLSRMMVITRNEKLSELTSEETLAGKAIAVAMNTSLHTWALEQNKTVFKNNPMRIVLIPYGAELQAVESGSADFTLLDAEVSLWESQHRYREMAVAFPVGPVDEIGWGYRKQDHNLGEAVQAFFSEQIAYEDSKLNRIWEEEFGLTLKQLRLLVLATQSGFLR